MKNVKERALFALKNLVLFSAVVHMVILAYFAVKEWDIEWLNYFNILDLEYFWPGILEMPYSLFIATVVVVGVYGIFFFWKPRS